MTTFTNRQLQLARRPRGRVLESDFEIVQQNIPAPSSGGVVVRVNQLSLDPAMRGWMNGQKSYIEPVGLNEVMRAFGVGEVVASAHDDFSVGDVVTGDLGVQEFASVTGDDLVRVDPELKVPQSAYLGVLGMTGVTAFFGLLEVGEFKPGQTVLVSGAAGAVGGTVGQLVSLLGGRAIGIAGGESKCAHAVDVLGFEAAIDYKSADVAQEIRRLAPEGIDVFFDNVGGDILDAGLANLSVGARVVICGAISQYNATEVSPGPSNYRALLVRRARMEGFIIFDYEDRYDEAIRPLAQWLTTGDVVSVEDIVEGGIEDYVACLTRLFDGDNLGKQILSLTGR